MVIKERVQIELSEGDVREAISDYVKKQGYNPDPSTITFKPPCEALLLAEVDY